MPKKLILIVLALAIPGLAAVETLSSSALRVELTTSPYSYRVLEASTGKTLLSHSSLAFTEKRLAAASASGVTRTGNSLRAKLQIAGSSETAQVSFTFTKPEVLQVLISYGSPDSGEVFQEFNDQGEHYYGIWEYPFGGSIDCRGADRFPMSLRYCAPSKWMLLSAS